MNTTWKQLTAVQVGGAICLPVVMVGQVLASKMGLSHALLAIGLGNFFLLLTACIMSTLSTHTRKSSVEQALDFFGSYGPHILGSLFLLAMVGWFAIQLNIMGMGVLSLFPGLPFPSVWVHLVMGALVTLVALRGMRGLTLFAKTSIPLLLGTLGMALTFQQESLEVLTPTLSLGDGISLILATSLVCVIDMPTYWKHVRSKKEGLIAACVLFGIAIPAIESIGAFLGANHGAQDVLRALTGNGGSLWMVWVVCFLLLAGWASNNANLYSAGINSFALFPQWNEKKRILFLGAIGTCLACLDVLSHFEKVLEIMGVAVASMGGAVLGSYLLKRMGGYCSLLLGLLGGLCSLFGWIELTKSPVVDAYLYAFVFCLLGRKYATADI